MYGTHLPHAPLLPARAGFLVSVYGKGRFIVNNKMGRKNDFELPPRSLWLYYIIRKIRKIIFYICKSGMTAVIPDLLFHGEGRNGKWHLDAVTQQKMLCVGSDFLLNLARQSKQTGQNPKIRAIAYFNALKTYKTAKKIFLFLVRLLGGLRLLYGQNLLL